MKPWRETVTLGDVFHDENMDFPELRDAIVARLRQTRWFRNADPDDCDGVHEIIDYHLTNAEDEDEFDGWWNELYDHADRDRVWLDTFPQRAPR